MGTLGFAITQAVKNNDLETIGIIVGKMRSKGFSYDETYEIVHTLTGIDLPEWDQLIQDSE